MTRLINDNQFLGIRRKNGQIGIRNHLAIISTVACSNFVVEKIAAGSTDAVACTHPYGCDQLGADLELTIKVLENIGRHPNVGAVLIVGLGCEQIIPDELAHKIRKADKPVEIMGIQDEGGTTKSIRKGIEICTKLEKQMRKDIDKVPITLKDLVIGLECGGSDYTSGIIANPALGLVTEELVSQGAKVVFGETTEILGAEHILTKRAISKEIAEFIIDKVNNVECFAREMKVDIRGSQPSPGNIKGGLSSIEEKSLGAIAKIGNSLIVDVLEYADSIKTSGLSFMDTPGNDLFCTCGLVAGGAHMVIFTTGLGTPMGFPIAPIIKVTASSKAARVMSENIDVDISNILFGAESIQDGANVILDKIFNVAKGELVAAEKLGHSEFGFNRIGPTL